MIEPITNTKQIPFKLNEIINYLNNKEALQEELKVNARVFKHEGDAV